MSKRLQALKERKHQLAADARKLNDGAAAAGRDLTDDEKVQVDGYLAQLRTVNADIEREEAMIEAARTMPALEGARVSDNLADDPKRGFRTFGEYMRSVHAAGIPGGKVDERLRIGAAAPTTYGSEGVGADGGYAVPTDYAREIMRLSLEEDALLPLCDNIPVEGNGLTFPSDETTPWGTDGCRAYWEGEAQAATATKPKLTPNTLRLKKLLGLVPLSDELLQDTTAMGAYAQGKLAESIRFKTNDAIVNGDGVGKPLGFFPAPALVSVAKEAGQAADTIVAANIAKMYARMPVAGLRGAVWLVNPDAYNQLLTLSIANQPIWTPPQAGFKDAPGGLLLGRPVLPSDTCQTLGDQGDIFFFGAKQYRAITKSGGIEAASSIHLYFDAGATAFRAVFRMDGQPSLKAAIVPAKGAANRSYYVTLDARA